MSSVFSRTEELVRTLRAACTDAAAPEDSQGATASTTPRCTATQVPGRSRSCRVKTPAGSRLCLSPEIPEACGPDATCINRPNSPGYDCRCHLGKFGNKCTEGKTWSSKGRGGLVREVSAFCLTLDYNVHYRG